MKGTKIKALVAGLAIMVLAGCSMANTKPDEVALHYKAGPISSTKFANCIDPGQRDWDGPGDIHYYYPAGQRTYTFTGARGADSSPYDVPTKDNVQLTVSGVLTFTLNTTCATLKKFHEQIGLKYQPIMNSDGTTADGWDKLLDNYLGQPLQLAITQATTSLGWKDLYNNPTTKTQWESDVTAALPSLIAAQTGGQDYFTNLHITLQKPAIPTALQTALEQAQEAVQQNAAQAQRNIQVNTQLEAIRALVKVLGPNGYNVYQALQDCADPSKHCSISVLPIPEGSNLTVTGK